MSQGPDSLYYYGTLPWRKEYEQAANVTHWDGSLDCFCHMLDHTKKSNPSIRKHDVSDGALRAYQALAEEAYFWYSHAIVDMIVHPTVYRISNDHWVKHPKKRVRAHKKLESIMDTFLLKEKMDVSPHQLKFGELICNSGLDPASFELLNVGMSMAYGVPDPKTGITRLESIAKDIANVNLNYFELFGKFHDSREHPFYKAYEMLAKYSFIPFHIPSKFDNFFGLRGVIPKDNLDKLEERIMTTHYWNDMFFHVLKSQELKNSFQRIPNSRDNRFFDNESQLLPRYTVLELFDLAVKATRMVIQAGEAFFASDYKSSREFFREKAKGVVYLDENYNMDTGLPSRFNADLLSLGDDLKKINRFKIDLIDENLLRVAGYRLNPRPLDMAA
ncbi:hypothetical protein HYS31_02905 [Candidatus Woesearchaeota archaeon]|nr:hypothetical protein [Candidatus Woesearchaeota archaeon]